MANRYEVDMTSTDAHEVIVDLQLLGRFLFLVFHYFNVLRRDPLEDACVILDQLQNLTRYVSLDDNLVLPLCVLRNRCTCCKFLGEELGCFFQLNVYPHTMRISAMLSLVMHTQVAHQTLQGHG